MNNETTKTISFKVPSLPKFSIQMLIMVLLIGVGTLQTVQLFGLQKAVASTKVKPAAAATQTGGNSSGGSQLPSMVGGC